MHSPSLDIFLDEIGKKRILTRQEIVELVPKIHAGDLDARNVLIEHNIKFVVSVAKRYQYQGLSMEDLVAEGIQGLIVAAERYELGHGTTFLSYAIYWVRQAIILAIKDQSRTIRLPHSAIKRKREVGKAKKSFVAKEGREPSEKELSSLTSMSEDQVKLALHSPQALSLDAPKGQEGISSRLWHEQFASKGPNPEDALLFQEEVDELARALEVLRGEDPRLAEIIILFFGIGQESPMNLAEIGKQIGVSGERVRQLRSRALQKLKDTLETPLGFLEEVA